MGRIYKMLAKTYVGVVGLGVDRNAACNLVRDQNPQKYLNSQVELLKQRGNKRKLDQQQMEELRVWALDMREKHGKCRSKDAEEWIYRKWGVTICSSTANIYLKAMGVPRRASKVVIESAPPQVVEVEHYTVTTTRKTLRKLDDDQIHDLHAWVTEMKKMLGCCPAKRTEAWAYNKWGVSVSWSTMCKYLKDLENGDVKPASRRIEPKLDDEQLKEVRRFVDEAKTSYALGKKAEMFIYDKWGIDMTPEAIRRCLRNAGMEVSFKNVKTDKDK